MFISKVASQDQQPIPKKMKRSCIINHLLQESSQKPLNSKRVSKPVTRFGSGTNSRTKKRLTLTLHKKRNKNDKTQKLVQ